MKKKIINLKSYKAQIKQKHAKNELTTQTILDQISAYKKKYHGEVNPPIVRNSTVIFKSTKDYRRLMALSKKKVSTQNDLEVYKSIYGIYGAAPASDFENLICQLEDMDACIQTSSGLSAITITLLALTKPGDHILLSDSVYGPTREFVETYLTQQKVDVEFYHPLIGKKIKQHIKENTALIFTESPGSQTFEIQDIPAITKVANKYHIPVILDNTWATPLYFSGRKHGVDIVIHAATKYILGHSDGMLGLICCQRAYTDKIFKQKNILGDYVTPDISYQALRGLRTMAIRLKQHEISALIIAQWLKARPEIQQVLHPALPTYEGHKIWKRDFKGSAGLFSIQLKKKYTLDQAFKFCDGLNLFHFGASFGGFESLVFKTKIKRTFPDSNTNKNGQIIRLCIGLDHPNDLIADLRHSFIQLHK